MKSKILIAVLLSLCLVTVLAIPVSAGNLPVTAYNGNPITAYNWDPPITITYPPNATILSETIIVAGISIPVVVSSGASGGGTIINHVVKYPNGNEDSWFKIVKFSGTISIAGGPQIPFSLSNVLVTYVYDAKKSLAQFQPFITISSPVPFALPAPISSPVGTTPFSMGLSGQYKLIIMMGAKVIFAK